MSSSVFILIPAYNRRDTTLHCLRCLHSDVSIQTWSDVCIVVIDDGSADGTAAAVEAEFPAVQVLAGDGNLWWTGAMRKGMEHAFAADCQVVFWLNDDCVPRPGSLRHMYDTSVEQGGAIIGAACYIAETGVLKPTGARGRVPVAAQPEELCPVDELSGHCVCIPRAVMESIGFPETHRFPHYHGDSSYTLRATRAGFSAYLLGNARVDHPGVIKARPEDFVEFGKVSAIQAFQQLFLSKKSLYFLPTQFFYNTEKYGPLYGTALFCLKLGRWLARWIGLMATTKQL